MATLDSFQWNAVTPQMQRLLTAIGQLPFSSRFYLAGGTALALQIGHRRSVDFDFFSETDEVEEQTRNEVIRGLSAHSPEVVESTGGNLLLLVSGIRTGFFHYGYPLIGQPVPFGNTLLASMEDIGLMKLDALISRGSRKDFYDLFYISRKIPFADLFQHSEQKYALFRDFPLMVLEAMTLFDNADRDIQPELFENLPWEEIKQFFLHEAETISRKWFGQEGY